VWHALPLGSQDDTSDTLPPAVHEALAVLAQHLPVKEAARLVAEMTGRSKQALYQHALNARQG
jgi:16S rRNA C1402 (ribose-2'-O) methylase RsmI